MRALRFHHPPALPLTGERTLPGIPDERYWFERHVVAYRLARADLDGRTVLDAGCGEGYGLALLRRAGAARVVGVDNDVATVAHARRRYAGGRGVEVVEADLTDLPLPEDSVDRVVSFQVIEHLHDVPAFLAELRRVLRPGGALWLATPNRLTFTPGSDAPVNPFHVREFTADELAAELAGNGFATTALLGVHHGRWLRAIERLLGEPLPSRLTAGPPATWPRWLRRAVHRIHAGWFVAGTADLDVSLDLVAVARPAP